MLEIRIKCILDNHRLRVDGSVLLAHLINSDTYLYQYNTIQYNII